MVGDELEGLVVTLNQHCYGLRIASPKRLVTGGLDVLIKYHYTIANTVADPHSE